MYRSGVWEPFVCGFSRARVGETGVRAVLFGIEQDESCLDEKPFLPRIPLAFAVEEF
jgi:hypothetical protein